MGRAQIRTLLNLVRGPVLSTLVLGAVLVLPLRAWCNPPGFQGPRFVFQAEDLVGGDRIEAWAVRDAVGGERAGMRLALSEKGATGREWGFEDSLRLSQPLPRGDREDFDRKRRTWESLQPERKERLRERMEQFRELPPEERDLYRQRYRQWQSLSPEERERMKRNLDRWNDLPQEERERMRHRFR